MELALLLIAIIITFFIVRYLFKKLLFCIFILICAGTYTIIYKIPYSISTFSICILIYSIKYLFSELINIGGIIIKPGRFYLNGYYEKLVCLLFSLNYVLFVAISYMLLISKSFYIIDIMDLVISFCLTWVCIWFIGYIKDVFLKYINTIECKM